MQPVIARSTAAVPARSPTCQPLSVVEHCRTDIRAEDVVLSELLNQRGPAAWLAAPCCSCATSSSSESSNDSMSWQESGCSREAPGAALLRLARHCIERREVLTLNTQMQHFDLLFVPRKAAADDGIGFAVFATRVRPRAKRHALPDSHGLYKAVHCSLTLAVMLTLSDVSDAQVSDALVHSTQLISKASCYPGRCPVAGRRRAVHLADHRRQAGGCRA